MSSIRYVADSSAILAFLLEEPGADFVERELRYIAVSSVNFGEVVAKLIEKSMPAELVDRRLAQLRLAVIAYDRAQAMEAGLLRAATRSAGLSMGDRACLALARREKLPALTADQAWRGLEDVASIQFIR